MKSLKILLTIIALSGSLTFCSLQRLGRTLCRASTAFNSWKKRTSGPELLATALLVGWTAGTITAEAAIFVRDKLKRCQSLENLNQALKDKVRIRNQEIARLRACNKELQKKLHLDDVSN